MDFFSITLIALGLSADCFAVSIGISIARKRFSLPAMLRVAAIFGLFQGLMPVAGWLLGQSLVAYLAPAANWLAFLLLAFIAGRMLWNSLKGNHKTQNPVDYSRGFSLLILAIATSIDALAAGLGFGLLEASILQASLIIGIVAFLASAIAFSIGARSGALLGRWAEALGALLLLFIAIRILLGNLV